MQGGLQAIRFRQNYRGVPVYRASLTLLTRPEADHGVVLIRNNAWDLRDADLAPPAITAEGLSALLEEGLPDWTFTEPELLVYAHRHGRPVTARYAYRLRGFFASEEEDGPAPEAYAFIIDASTEELDVLEAWSLVAHFGNPISGQVTGSVWTATEDCYFVQDGVFYCGSPQGGEVQDLPLGDVQVFWGPLESWETCTTGLTDESGYYVIDALGPAAPLWVDLDQDELEGPVYYPDDPYVAKGFGGAYVWVMDRPWMSPALMSAVDVKLRSAENVAPGTSGVNLHFDHADPALHDSDPNNDPWDQEFVLAQLTAYYWLTKSSQLAAEIVEPDCVEGEPGPLGLCRPLRCFVNSPDQPSYYPLEYVECDHWEYFRDSIEVGRSRFRIGASSGCHAMPSILLHEHMHRFIAFGTGDDNMRWDFAEGTCDSWAALLLDSACIGPGYDVPVGGGFEEIPRPCYRHLAGDDMHGPQSYPCTLGTTKQHEAGLVLGGSFWDTCELMKAASLTDPNRRLQRLLLGMVQLTEPDIERALVVDLLTLDDNADWGPGRAAGRRQHHERHAALRLHCPRFRWA